MNRFDYLFIALSLVLLVVFSIALVSSSIDLWVFLTRLGDPELYMVIGILLYYLSPNVYAGLGITAPVFFSGCLNLFLKYTFMEPRPPVEQWFIKETGYGFPSGHAQVSSSFWSMFSSLYRRFSIVLFTILIVTIVSTSRIYLGVHYVHQVVGGVLFGLLGFIVSYTAYLYGLRHGSILGFIILGFVNFVFGVFNVFFYGVEEASVASTLLGFSIGLLLFLVVAWWRMWSIVKIGFEYRVFLAVFSILLVFVVQVAFSNLFARIVGFTIVGFIVFASPFLLEGYCK